MITLSTAKTIRLSESIVFQHAISAGKCFSDAAWRKILLESAQYECYQKILRLLAVRARTETEIRRRLSKQGFASPVIDAAIETAKRLRLVDDASVAAAYVDQQLSLGKIGLKRIIANLRKRGLDMEVVNDVVRDVGDRQTAEEVEFQNAFSVGKTKWASMAKEQDMSRKKVKFLRFLSHRGFPSEVCFRVLEKVVSGD